jgi:hypothetical protein
MLSWHGRSPLWDFRLRSSVRLQVLGVVVAQSSRRLHEGRGISVTSISILALVRGGALRPGFSGFARWLC